MVKKFPSLCCIQKAECFSYAIVVHVGLQIRVQASPVIYTAVWSLLRQWPGFSGRQIVAWRFKIPCMKHSSNRIRIFGCYHTYVVAYFLACSLSAWRPSVTSHIDGYILHDRNSKQSHEMVFTLMYGYILAGKCCSVLSEHSMWSLHYKLLQEG